MRTKDVASAPVLEHYDTDWTFFVILAISATAPYHQSADTELSFWDPHSGCRFVAATPRERPDLWQTYVASALTCYRRHDVLKALDYDLMRDGSTTSLFFVAIQPDGRVVAGMRAQGPYAAAEEAHAFAEWGGSAAQEMVRNIITERLQLGVIECKTGWASDAATNRRGVSDAMSRLPVHFMTMLGARFAFVTAARHTISMWHKTGALVAKEVTPVHYPDARYLTSMVWWDRMSFADHASPEQLPKILSESAELVGGTQSHRTRTLLAAHSS